MAKRRTGPTFIQRSRQESSEQKAIYHNITGAGRRGVKREFLDLGPEDQQQLGVQLEKLWGASMKAKGA